MDDICIVGRSNEDHLFKHFAARYDVPAYVRRARRVQEAFDDLVSHCRKQRDECLLMVRVHTKAALALAGAGVDEQLHNLGGMLDLALPPSGAVRGSVRRLQRALRELNESITRFNDRWLCYLRELDLTPLNRLRDEYNRYYLIEKECALRSARLARLGFRPLVPVTVEELHALMPPLPVPLRDVL